MQSLYLIQIAIGTPKQTFSVSIDTGSADLWIPSKQCPVTACPGPRFDPAVSVTYQETTLPYNITYGNGYANGNYIIESVTLGGLTVPQQQIGLTSLTNNIIPTLDPSSSNNNNNNRVTQNGILGLGFPSVTAAATDHQSPYLTFVFQLIQQNLIDQPVFSIYLNNSIHTEGWDHGELTLGGYNPKKFIGDIYYEPLLQPLPSHLTQWDGYWIISSQGYSLSVNSNQQQEKKYKFQQLLPTIIDTGAMLSHFPFQLTQSIMTDLFGNISSNVYEYEATTGHYIFTSTSTSSSTCSYIRNLYQNHTLQFTISSNFTLQIPVKDLIVTYKQLCVFGIAVTSSKLVGNENDQQPMLFLGDSILKSTYLIFDIGQHRIGFASPNHSGIFNESNSPSNNNTNSNNSNNSNNNNSNGAHASHASILLPQFSIFSIYLFIFLIYIV
ncbi:unnamed protein product [Cunninghamella echinulata]